MPVYDPRVLITRLEISRKYNLEMVRRYEKLNSAYDKLMDNYTALVKEYVIERKMKGVNKSTQTK
jgi:hypothetical protein